MNILEEAKGDCDIVISVTHSITCPCLLEKPFCVICGEEEDIYPTERSKWFSLEGDKFCGMCLDIIHTQVIMPLYSKGRLS